MRSLGGSIGLAVGVIVFNSRVRTDSELASTLGPKQMSLLLNSPLVIGTFTPEQQALTSRVYAKAFTQEMQVATYIATACFVVSLLTYQRDPPQPLKKPDAPLQARTDVESKG